MQSRNYQSLRYEDLCLQPDVELPLGYQMPKFNTFNGKGNPIAHLKDYCSRLIGIGHNESIWDLHLFIQSLSGHALVWYTKQDFSKWSTWDDMAHNFVKQYEFNLGADPDMHSLYKIKIPHESFQDYAIRWRVEASKVHPPLSCIQRKIISCKVLFALAWLHPLLCMNLATSNLLMSFAIACNVQEYLKMPLHYSKKIH